ncbi:hypothetical protein QA640_35980 [Bradyrhizobium sp. CB82]|uniref:hypothetical protein n=1 Tax=Bradyrhizobium sp. CB82 TaxID=3039159 RepID=UPI0024B1701E|nr:hypothetical protein [Bradyrhizobium sp. CB82]WFU39701.1 hypothetical protein QA640_35980 [Bradyrhizobium sp. CB82]
MLIIRYFLFTGALLLILLFIADRYLPAATVAQADDQEIDRTIIRIHSARVLPEKIVFDTSNPLQPAAPAAAERFEDLPRQASETGPLSAPAATRQTAPVNKRVVQRIVHSHRATSAGQRRLAFDQ